MYSILAFREVSVFRMDCWWVEESGRPSDDVPQHQNRRVGHPHPGHDPEPCGRKTLSINGGFAGGEADAVAAAGFGFVERLVCVFEQVMSSAGRCRDCGGDAAGDREGGLADGRRTCARRGGRPATSIKLSDAFGDLYCCVLSCGRKKDYELFAAEPCGEIVFDAEAFEQEMSGALENLVAVEMAVGVVYTLEVVEVDEDE